MPYSTRVNTSPPKWSMPNGWSRPGGWRRLMVSMEYGSYGVNHGAKRAIKVTKLNIPVPVTSMGCDMKRRHALMSEFWLAGATMSSWSDNVSTSSDLQQA